MLVLTTFDDDDLVHKALRAGASGFLLKDTRPAQLLESVQVVAAGDALLAPRVTRRLIERFAAPPGPVTGPRQDGLTDREREVFVAVSHGLSKLGCRDRAQLVMHAYESGLTVPGRP